VAFNLFEPNMRDIMTYIVFPAILFLTLGLDRFCKNKVFDKLEIGGVIYEIYLWHNVGICIWMIFSKKTKLINLDSYGLMFIFAGIIVLLSVIMYHCVEKNITNILKKYEQKFCIIKL
jgi:peptidoglycan/LPS O-acetylase OafA/YrhL